MMVVDGWVREGRVPAVNTVLESWYSTTRDGRYEEWVMMLASSKSAPYLLRTDGLGAEKQETGNKDDNG